MDATFDLKSDVERLLKTTGWSALRLAQEAGVSKDSLYRLLRGDRDGVNSRTLRKLAPYLYGDRHPGQESAGAG